MHTLLAIDDVSLPLRWNVCLHLNKPTVRREPVLTASPLDSNAPDNLGAQFYGTVLYEADRFRMWYYALHRWAGRRPQLPWALEQPSPHETRRIDRPRPGELHARGCSGPGVCALHRTADGACVKSAMELGDAGQHRQDRNRSRTDSV